MSSEIAADHAPPEGAGTAQAWRSAWGFDRRDQCVRDPVVRQRLDGREPSRWDRRRAWRAGLIAEALHLWWHHPPG